MNNLKTYIGEKWPGALLILAIFVAGTATGSLIMHRFSGPSNPVSVHSHPALALTVVPISLSAESIKQGSEFKTAVSFTNTSNRNWEFTTNGPGCFQFLDLRILDQSGKNHAAIKAGKFYVLTPDERQVTSSPGETVAGTLSMDLIVNGQLPPGAYSAQAFFDYKELHFESNVVRFTVTAD